MTADIMDLPQGTADIIVFTVMQANGWEPRRMVATRAESLDDVCYANARDFMTRTDGSVTLAVSQIYRLCGLTLRQGLMVWQQLVETYELREHVDRERLYAAVRDENWYEVRRLIDWQEKQSMKNQFTNVEPGWRG